MLSRLCLRIVYNSLGCPLGLLGSRLAGSEVVVISLHNAFFFFFFPGVRNVYSFTLESYKEVFNFIELSGFLQKFKITDLEPFV